MAYETQLDAIEAALLTAGVATGTIAPTVLAPVVGWAKTQVQRNRSKFKSLPELVVSSLKPHFKYSSPTFGTFDLNKIRYANNASGVPSGFAGITFENHILFSSAIDFENKADVQLLIHEIQHSYQYFVVGGLLPFLIKYAVNGSLQIIGGLNPHKDMNLEREARNKPNEIMDDVFPFGRTTAPVSATNHTITF